MKKSNNEARGAIRMIWGCLIFIVIMGFIVSCGDSDFENGSDYNDDSNVFRIISSTSTAKLDTSIIKYGRSIGLDIEIDHFGDLEIVDILNEDSKSYDAVWISNSIWLYMLENSYLVTDSKSIVINPVVMGITKSKAESLGFVNKSPFKSTSKFNSLNWFSIEAQRAWAYWI